MDIIYDVERWDVEVLLLFWKCQSSSVLSGNMPISYSIIERYVKIICLNDFFVDAEWNKMEEGKSIAKSEPTELLCLAGINNIENPSMKVKQTTSRTKPIRLFCG